MAEWKAQHPPRTLAQLAQAVAEAGEGETIDLGGRALGGPIPKGQTRFLIDTPGVVLCNGSLELPQGAGILITSPGMVLRGLTISNQGWSNELPGSLGQGQSTQSKVALVAVAASTSATLETCTLRGGWCAVLCAGQGSSATCDSCSVRGSKCGFCAGEGGRLTVRACTAVYCGTGYASLSGGHVGAGPGTKATDCTQCGFMAYGHGSRLAAGAGSSSGNCSRGFDVGGGATLEAGEGCAVTGECEVGFSVDGAASRLVCGPGCTAADARAAGFEVGKSGGQLQLGAGCEGLVRVQSKQAGPLTIHGGASVAPEGAAAAAEGAPGGAAGAVGPSGGAAGRKRGAPAGSLEGAGAGAALARNGNGRQQRLRR